MRWNLWGILQIPSGYPSYQVLKSMRLFSGVNIFSGDNFPQPLIYTLILQPNCIYNMSTLLFGSDSHCNSG